MIHVYTVYSMHVCIRIHQCIWRSVLLEGSERVCGTSTSWNMEHWHIRVRGHACNTVELEIKWVTAEYDHLVPLRCDTCGGLRFVQRRVVIQLLRLKRHQSSDNNTFGLTKRLLKYGVHLGSLSNNHTIIVSVLFWDNNFVSRSLSITASQHQQQTNTP